MPKNHLGSRSIHLPVIALLVVLVSSTAQAQTPPVDSASVVETSGTGEVRLPPDKVLLLFRVTSRGETPSQATEAAALAVASVIDTLTALLLSGDSLEVRAVNLETAEDRDRRSITGYDADISISMVLRNIDRLSMVLTAAVEGGVTDLPAVRYESDHREEAAEEALSQAYEQARAQAEVLARAADLRLGPLLNLSTVYDPSYRVGLQRGYLQIPAVSPQSVVVSATVYARWRLLP